jgi:ribonuclease E
VDVDGEERPKKRTRRGSRGGKRRKKKPAETDAGEVDAEAPPADGRIEAVAATVESPADEAPEAGPAAAVVPDGDAAAAPARPRARRTPKIHVPVSGVGADGKPGATAVTAVPSGSVPPSEPVAEAADEPAPSTDDAGPAEDGAEPGSAAPRKRTRRGSRGGRGRKKKPAQSTEGGADGSAGTDTGANTGTDAEPHEAPTVAVEADAGAAAENGDLVTEPAAKPAPRPRKRTPRSTASTAQSEGAGVATVAPAVETPSAATEAPVADGYVPMSEWLDDFEQSRGDG